MSAPGISELLETEKGRSISTGFKDGRPSDYVYALMSQHVYESRKLKKNDTLPKFPDWKVEMISVGKANYFGVLYVNEYERSAVLAHQGYDTVTDYEKYLNDTPYTEFGIQKEEALNFLKKALNFITNKAGFKISFTGHSLGGVLAELCLFYCCRDYSIFANAVTFESPGSRECIEKFQSELNPLRLDKLDIIKYVLYPNKINTLGHHISTLYHITPDAEEPLGSSITDFPFFHSIDQIVSLFLGEDRPEKIFYMKDWPVAGPKNKIFKFSEMIDYRLSHKWILPLRNFNEAHQNLILKIDKLKQKLLTTQGNCQEVLEEKLPKAKISKNIVKNLMACSILKKPGYDLLFVELSNQACIIKFRKKISEWAQEACTALDILQEDEPEIIIKDTLGSIFNVPNYIAGFVERRTINNEEVLKIIERKISEKGICFITAVAITGMPGAGKSQLSYYYAYLMKSKYENRVYYINAENRINIVKSFRAFLRICLKKGSDFVEKFSEQELTDALKEFLIKTQKILFIFDNVESEEFISPWLKIVDKHEVLITSRHKSWVNIESLVSLDVFNQHEKNQVVNFILKVLNEKYSGNETQDAAEELAKEMAWLPLAISQSIYTIKNISNIKEYLLEFRANQSKRKKLLSKKAFLDDIYKATVFNTWDISISKIEKTSSTAKTILNLSAYFDAAGISKSLFSKKINNLPEVLEVICDNALMEVVDGQQSKDSLKIHRLLQEVIRIQHKEDGLSQPLVQEALNLVFDNFNYDLKELETITTAEQLAPHVLSVARHAYACDVDVIKAETMFSSLINFYNYWKQGFRALELVKEFVGYQLKIYGKNSVKYGLSLSDCAETEYYNSDFKNSEAHYNEAVEIYKNQEHLSEDEKCEYAGAVGGLGDVFYKIGKFSDSIDQYKKSLEILKGCKSKKQEFQIGLILHQLGNVHQKRSGEADCQNPQELILEAKSFYDRAMESKLRYYKRPDHPQVARTRKELGNIHLALKDYNIAYKEISMALENERAYYKTDLHPDIVKALYSLAEAVYELGDKVDSARNYELADKLWNKLYPEVHHEAADHLVKQGILYARHKDLSKASDKFSAAYDIYRLRFGEDNPQTKNCKLRLDSLKFK